jgi:hypothetical protein
MRTELDGVTDVVGVTNEKEGRKRMKGKSRFILGVLTALAMLAATFVLPRGGAVRDMTLALFPLTVGVWGIFVLLFVKLK